MALPPFYDVTSYVKFESPKLKQIISPHHIELALYDENEVEIATGGYHRTPLKAWSDTMSFVAEEKWRPIWFWALWEVDTKDLLRMTKMNRSFDLNSGSTLHFRVSLSGDIPPPPYTYPPASTTVAKPKEIEIPFPYKRIVEI